MVICWQFKHLKTQKDDIMILGHLGMLSLISMLLGPASVTWHYKGDSVEPKCGKV